MTRVCSFANHPGEPPTSLHSLFSREWALASTRPDNRLYRFFAVRLAKEVTSVARHRFADLCAGSNHLLWLNRTGTPTRKIRARAAVPRRSSIRILLSGTRGFSRLWRSPAAKSVPPNFSAISTGMPRSLAPTMLETDENPKLDLAAEMLRRRGTVHIKAWGTSMLPSVWPGDFLTIQGAADDEVVPGDIVLVRRNNRFLVHRLVEMRPSQDCNSLITRGDAMPDNDPPAAVSELLGRVAGIRRGDQTFVPIRRVSLLDFVLARALCRWGRFRSLTLRIHTALLQAGTSHP